MPQETVLNNEGDQNNNAHRASYFSESRGAGKKMTSHNLDASLPQHSRPGGIAGPQAALHVDQTKLGAIHVRFF